MKRVAVTRAAAQSDQLSAWLRDAGFAPVPVPVIEIAPPADGGAELRAAADRLAAGAYEWMIATSVNTVDRLVAVASAPPWPVRAAAIGPATAQRLDRAGQRVELVPGRYVAEGLLDAFGSLNRSPGRVLLPRAAVARDALPDGLRRLGYQVDVVEAYRTVRPQLGDNDRTAIQGCDIVTFTSPSTVHNFVDLLGRDALPPVVACIGPVTAAACAEHEIPVTVEAAIHTMAGLVQALQELA